MKQARLGYAFENLLMELFQKLNFQVEREKIIHKEWSKEVDFVLSKDGSVTWVEVKFYRDDRVSNSNIMNAVSQLASLLTNATENEKGLIIVSAYVAGTLKEEIQTKYGIIVWDRTDLYLLIKSVQEGDKLLEDFEQLLLEAKQGTDTSYVFEKIEKKPKHYTEYLKALQTPFPQKRNVSRPKKGSELCLELNAIPGGRDGWRQYELKCIEILKYIFEEELSNWDAQNSTDDELSRFDMICRIIGQGGFWGSLIQSFHTRYVLFEFKNYSDPIGQDQIYTTERYLYLRGLRSVGFIISRVGGKPQAMKAAKGALREHGKLIIILDNKSLCKMLQMKDSGDNPSDLLSDILDDFLISLSR